MILRKDGAEKPSYEPATKNQPLNLSLNYRQRKKRRYEIDGVLLIDQLDETSRLNSKTGAQPTYLDEAL
jgi:hypothetical protein